MTFLNNTFLVLGLSKTGISVAKYLAGKGAKVLVTEGREKKSQDEPIIKELQSMGIEVETGGHSDVFINAATFAITSPGIPPHSQIITKLKNNDIDVISELELASMFSITPFIIITGTNGKTTTTALSEYIFKTTYNVEACGNYGTPVCDLIDKNLDAYICEASSYQLQMSPSLTPRIAIFTNFAPDHIDWHQGVDNYFNAKASVVERADTIVLNGQDKKLVEFANDLGIDCFFFDKNTGKNCSYIQDSSIYYMQDGSAEKIIDIKDCSLIGHHNYQNIMCSIIAAKLEGISTDNIIKCLKSFKAPEHRLELFADNGKTKFYNDSKATNPEAAIVAIKSFLPTQNNVLIAGGTDKKTSLDEFCSSVDAHIKTVVLIGEGAARFSSELSSSGFENIVMATTLEDATKKALATNPDNVLLSPACASFDMFDSYEHRGQAFKKVVLNIIK